MCAEINTALLTGTFALAGVILSQLTSAALSFFEKRHKRKILLREKYEELSFYVLDSFSMQEKLFGYKSNDESLIQSLRPVHANKAHMLALLYFHHLQKHVEQYITSYSKLCILCHSLYDPRSELMLGEQMINNPEFLEASEALRAAKDCLFKQIAKYATEYAYQ